MISRFKKNDFLKSVVILMSGTAIAQIITILISPFLSRLYQPEFFGIFAIYTSIISILTVIVTGRYELAIVLPKSESEARNVFALSNLIVVFFSILSSIIIYFFGERILILMNSPEFIPWLWWLPFSVFIAGIFQNLNYLLVRKSEYGVVSKSQISRTLGVSSVQLVSGLGNNTPGGLIGGQLFGQFLATLFMGYKLNSEKGELFKGISIREIKKMGKKYSDFPKYSASQGLFFSIGQNLPPVLLLFFYDSQVVGLFALSMRLLNLPINLIGNNFKQVFFQKASHSYNEGKDVYKLLKKTTIILSMIATIPLLTIILWGPNIFSVFLGESWYGSGQFAQIMTLWMFSVFISRPTMAAIQIFSMQRFLLVYEIIGTVVKIIFFIITANYFNAFYAILSYSLANVLFYLILMVYVFIKVKKKEDLEVLKIY